MRLVGPHALHDTSVAVAVTWFWWWDDMDSWTSTAQRDKLRERTEGMTTRQFASIARHSCRGGSGKASQRIDRMKPVPYPSQPQQDGSRGKPKLQTRASLCTDFSRVQRGRLGNLRRLSILHALISPKTTFQRHGRPRKDTLDLEGGSDEQDTQYTNK
ncbi:hypothetical protein KVR01_008316 [Diaporthe batatas]|uniref:uncharacterized protein n=1 Tax=Diaporthe batatas TaxID=748121 RepID=UPI001D050E00|nr:uncharacterized protein KVR01_008316 [Diaporthe batatas]KAG8162551.1 hypothetical protein KVR01_008316 [Diaporthe batatas]